MASLRKPLSNRTQYLVRSTCIFAGVELLIFLPFFWPEGTFTLRDVAIIGALTLICVAGGLLFSFMTWKALVSLGFGSTK
jgi:hypothetical protein